MEKFKIGDKVRLRDGLELGETYGPAHGFYREMKFDGGAEVLKVVDERNYKISKGATNYEYDIDMLEKEDEYIGTKFKVGDKIKVSETESGNYVTDKAEIVRINDDGEIEFKDLTGSHLYTNYINKNSYGGVELITTKLEEEDVDYAELINRSCQQTINSRMF